MPSKPFTPAINQNQSFLKYIFTTTFPLSTHSNFHRLQAQCKPIMETVSHHINSQFIELSAHRLLSIFKMAEVQVIMQTINTAALSIHQRSTSIMIMLFLSICPIVRWLNNGTGWGNNINFRGMTVA